jgi:hypothetical protein
VQRTKAKLEAPTGRGADLAQISGKGLFTVTASPTLADRLGRLLSQLVRAVERRGWTIVEGATRVCAASSRTGRRSWKAASRRR